MKKKSMVKFFRHFLDALFGGGRSYEPGSKLPIFPYNR